MADVQSAVPQNVHPGNEIPTPPPEIVAKSVLQQATEVTAQLAQQATEVANSVAEQAKLVGDGVRESMATRLEEIGLPKKNIPIFEKELKRKAYHQTGIILPAIDYFSSRTGSISWLTMTILISSITAVIVGFDALRLRSKTAAAYFEKVTQGLLREEERERLSAGSYYCLALLISHLCFNKIVVLAGFLFLMLGDTSAALIRKLTPSRLSRVSMAPLGTPKNKTLESQVTMFVTCFIVGMAVFIPYAGLWHAFDIALWGSLIGTIGEFFFFPDDSLLIPTLGGAAMQFALWRHGFPYWG